MKYLKYFFYILLHKYYVLEEGLKRKLNIFQLLIHDLDKLYDWNIVYCYVNFRFQNGWIPKPIKYIPREYNWKMRLAFLEHWYRNRHHWEHWLYYIGGDKVIALEMPDIYVKEMICDWYSVGKIKANGKRPDVVGWWLENKKDMYLHPKTLEKIEFYLKEFYIKSELK